VLDLLDLENCIAGTPIMSAQFDVPVDANDETFTAAAVSLLFGIILVMLARPTLVERNARPIKRTKKGSEIWRPNVIGRQYRIIRERAPEYGSGISPRMHWRRGHWRNQAYGEQFGLRREIWIEPILVNAPEA
jgi:hypothetical protein